MMKKMTKNTIFILMASIIIIVIMSVNTTYAYDDSYNLDLNGNGAFGIFSSGTNYQIVSPPIKSSGSSKSAGFVSSKPSKAPTPTSSTGIFGSKTTSYMVDAIQTNYANTGSSMPSYENEGYELCDYDEYCPVGAIGGEIMEYQDGGNWVKVGNVDGTPMTTTSTGSNSSSSTGGGSTQNFRTIDIAPDCPLSAGSGDILVEFGNLSIRSDLGLDRARDISNVSVPTGNYKITLAAFDGDDYGRDDQSQPNEQYYVSFENGSGGSLSKTNDTPDLADYVSRVTWTGVVNNSLYVPSGVSRAVAWHSAYPAGRSNSLVALCMLMEPVTSGPYCGDGILDTSAGEQCDDGNNINGDGCSAQCTFESGPYCGDGNLDAGEMCDDGNNIDGDGCSAVCTFEGGEEPVCSMGIAPTTIQEGGSADLNWSSYNITDVVIDQGIGDVAVNGSTSVSPTQNTTYTGTFSGPYGTLTCDANIIVLPPGDPEPACTMSFNPTRLPQGGGNTRLSWDSVNITDVDIDHGVGSVSPSGSMIIHRTSNATYTGVFDGPYGTVTCNASVTMGGGGENPPRVTLSQNTWETEPSFIYLSQIPYTATPWLPANALALIFRVLGFGGLLYGYYRVR